MQIECLIAVQNTVSVVIPAYNAAEFIAEAVLSAKAQSLAPIEILVIDDGSLDATADVARRAGARVIRQAKAGVSAARNRGIAEASGDWVAFLDADDRWDPRKLERQMDALSHCPQVGLAFTDFSRELGGRTVAAAWMREREPYLEMERRPIAADAVVVERGELARALPVENFVPTSSVIVRRNLLRSLDAFNPTLSFCEDLDMWLRLIVHTDAVIIEEPLVHYRLHDGNVSANWTSILAGDVELCERMIAHADRYHAHSRVVAQRDYARRYRKLGEHLLRSGFTREALAPLERSFSMKASVVTAFWVVVCRALMLQPVRYLHHAMRHRVKRLRA